MTAPIYLTEPTPVGRVSALHHREVWRTTPPKPGDISSVDRDLRIPLRRAFTATMRVLARQVMAPYRRGITSTEKLQWNEYFAPLVGGDNTEKESASIKKRRYIISPKSYISQYTYLQRHDLRDCLFRCRHDHTRGVPVRKRWNDRRVDDELLPQLSILGLQ
jgi:hypothetical protein